MPERTARMWLVFATLSGCSGTGVEPDTSDTSDTSDTETGEPEFVSLMDHTQWQVLDVNADPLADHRPDPVECPGGAWFLEAGNLEVDTGLCNYLGLHQPSLVDLVEGNDVQLILYHYELVAPEPATAHVAILIDGQLLWEESIAIPSDVGIYDLVFPSPLSAPAGSDVVFHLHNHGQNFWALQDLGTRN